MEKHEIQTIQISKAQETKEKMDNIKKTIREAVSDHKVDNYVYLNIETVNDRKIDNDEYLKIVNLLEELDKDITIITNESKDKLNIEKNENNIKLVEELKNKSFELLEWWNEIFAVWNYELALRLFNRANMLNPNELLITEAIKICKMTMAWLNYKY